MRVRIRQPLIPGGISGTTLKLIAMAAMLIDHIAASLLTSSSFYWQMRTIGRISFPIYCFLIAEGMFHTRDIERYFLRLWVFALISEIPFDLAIHGTWYYPASQNVFFTLALAVLLEVIHRRLKERGYGQLAVLFGAGLLVLAEVLSTDYGAQGLILIWLFYYLREWDRPGRRIRFLTVFLVMCLMWWGSIQLWALLGLALTVEYNGQRGRQMPKMLFYAFYPVHLLVLWGIGLLI